MTHSELVRIAAKWLQSSPRCALVLTEYNMQYNSERPDAIGWKPDGDSHLIECKTSRADFFADKTKAHRWPGMGMGQHRYYLIPAGLLKPDEVSEDWGIIAVSEKGAKLIRRPVRRTEFDYLSERRMVLNAARRACGYAIEPFEKSREQPYC